MPVDPEGAIRALVTAVQKGRIPVKRIDQSLARVLAAKQTVGLDKAKLVDLEAIADVVNSPEAAARAQEVADKAVTLVKNEAAAVPLRNPSNACFVVLAESRGGTQGQAISEELKKRGAVARTFQLDPSMPDS
jgi:beta-N-acetylhexosaminidase